MEIVSSGLWDADCRVTPFEIDRKDGTESMKETDSTRGQTGTASAKTVSESQSEMTELVLPNDTNPLGNLLGGRLMQFIDLVGAMAAYRHARTYVVTASMDHIDFIAPVHVGDLIILKSSVNRAYRTSMEIGVKAWVESIFAGTRRHVASAYLTFVALDESGRSFTVPPLIAETADELRRYEDAGRRRQVRGGERDRKRAAREAEGAAAI
jgi:acyl-CoA hydrolase